MAPNRLTLPPPPSGTLPLQALIFTSPSDHSLENLNFVAVFYLMRNIVALEH